MSILPGALAVMLLGLTTTAVWASRPASTAEEAPREIFVAEASPLRVMEPVQERSERLERVARQADQQIRHGFELAGRGAYFAARSEFIGALRLVAEGLDAEQRTDMHGQALASALTALREAEDFLPVGSRLEAHLDLVGIIAAHSTPVLKNNAKKATPLTAMKCYLTFAQEQFYAAAGREVAGSMALHALGKLHSTLAQKKNNLVAAAEPKTMVFFQAAMLVYPDNFMAANDLGVLLAKCGNYAEAQAMLQHSLVLTPQSTTCRNLAMVYRELGQTVLADRANRRAAVLQQVELARRKGVSTAADVAVQWMDPQTFARTSTNAAHLPNMRPPSQTGIAGRAPTVPGPRRESRVRR